jgi:hypothetical protein
MARGFLDSATRTNQKRLRRPAHRNHLHHIQPRESNQRNQARNKTAMQTQKKSPQYNSFVQYLFNHRTYPSHNQVSITAHQRGHTHNPQYSLQNVAQQPIRTRRRCASLTYASRGTTASDRGGFPNQDKMRRTRDEGLGYGDGRG